MAKTIEKKLKEAVQKIPTYAKKEGWVLTLDQDEGSLFYSPRFIPAKSELFQITDEYALYVDKQFNPRGVMIEYFMGNFLQHHRGLQELSKKVFNAKRKNAIVNQRTGDDSNAAILKSLLESLILQEGLGMQAVLHKT